jgi:hypothetical protein
VDSKRWSVAKKMVHSSMVIDELKEQNIRFATFDIEMELIGEKDK